MIINLRNKYKADELRVFLLERIGERVKIYTPTKKHEGNIKRLTNAFVILDSEDAKDEIMVSLENIVAIDRVKPHA